MEGVAGCGQIHRQNVVDMASEVELIQGERRRRSVRCLPVSPGASLRHRAAVGFVLVAVLLSGCATTPQTDSVRASTQFGHQISRVSGVPFFAQKAYQCGPASLAMALNWSGVPVAPEQLTPQVFLPKRKGSLQIEMVAAARRNGRIAYVIQPGLPSLLTELGAGNPVVILENLGLSWYPVWHYAVAVGVNVAADEVILRSGDAARQNMPLGLFERTWARSDDWGLLVLPPNRLPATAEKRPYLRAVAALERLNHFHQAHTAYTTALRRWPDSLVAQIGLGNTCYALKELACAEDAYRKATRLHPSSGIAYNNLAQTLADEGRLVEAVKSARQAVALGGPLAATFRGTLAKIETRQGAGASKEHPRFGNGHARQHLSSSGVDGR